MADCDITDLRVAFQVAWNRHLNRSGDFLNIDQKISPLRVAPVEMTPIFSICK